MRAAGIPVGRGTGDKMNMGETRKSLNGWKEVILPVSHLIQMFMSNKHCQY